MKLNLFLKPVRNGFALVEILVSVAVFSVIIFAVSQLFFVTQEAANLGKEKLKASSLALEYIEEVKNLRRSNWNLLFNGRYLLQTSSGNVSLVPTSGAEAVGNFSRYLTIENVFRDASGKIAGSGGTLDSSTKKITVYISWQGLHPGQLSYASYVTRYFENLAWTQTTVANFNSGEMNMTKIVNPSLADGEIQLMGGCHSGTPESLIYDDQLRNGWRTGCSGLPFWQRLICILIKFFSNASITTNSTTYTYNNSSYAIKIVMNNSSWSWVGINNFGGTCTVGFKNLHFYAYNPGSSPLKIWVTAIYGVWDKKEIILPPGVWTEVSLDYKDINGSYETSLKSIYFSKSFNPGDPSVTFYVDQMELTGGVGGYFTEGTLTSSVLDTGKSSAFNRISFNGDLPANTTIGFQSAVSGSSSGPWVFYGPEGTSSSQDLYLTQQGEGIWLGANIGRYFRYKAYLKSSDGVSTPILRDVTINYSP